MARINNGILGGISGKVGTVVGSSWRGIGYIRAKPKARSGGSSQKQIAQQARFRLMTDFLKTMKPLILMGYREKLPGMTEMNSALRYNLKNAVTGNYPDISIVYPQAQIIRGDLPNAYTPMASAGATGTINFGWVDNTGLGKAKADDKAIFIAHCPALKQTVYLIDALRGTEIGTLAVPHFSGQQVQTWISFVDAGGNEIATTIFTGAVAVL